uniref:Uncharacterized protein n=1 Tax=Schistosoma curassoni TaxID=6186 RepID=A0A183KXU0_9TREM
MFYHNQHNQLVHKRIHVDDYQNVLILHCQVHPRLAYSQ